ncbi:MAG: polysaccharide biosynthesis protein [Clostridia bacterium]|nr:polysaccharide biosynthesis protein [Clostridia bacterium]
MTRFQRFLWNSALMTVTALGTRAVGVLFNVYLSAKLGTSGLGQFSLIMSVYGFAVTVAVSGIHLAITRTVSEAMGLQDSASMRCALKTGLLYSLCFGLGAAALLWIAASPIAVSWLKDTQASAPLRILSLSLPLLSVSTCLNGYFVACRKAFRGAVVNVIGQAVRIGVTVFFLNVPSAAHMQSSVSVIAAATLISEASCFLLSLILFLPDTRRPPLAYTDGVARMASTYCGARSVLRIAFPIALTAYIRVGLQTLLHLLIPLGLQRAGLSSEAALSSYGTVHGMALPVILFPSALLTSVAGLLIPEIAEFRTRKEWTSVKRTTSIVLRTTLLFAVFVSGVILAYANILGTLLYQSTEICAYLHALAALVPVMYLDTMVDAVLKGLDLQIASMRYNIMDAAFCVLCAYILLPHLGILGYILLLYASEIFNLALSIGKMLSVTGLRLPVLRLCGGPVIAVIGASALTELFFRIIPITFDFAVIDLITRILVMIIFYGTLLFLLGCIGKNDIRVFFSLLLGRKAPPQGKVSQHSHLQKRKKYGIIPRKIM